MADQIILNFGSWWEKCLFLAWKSVQKGTMSKVLTHKEQIPECLLGKSRNTYTVINDNKFIFSATFCTCLFVQIDEPNFSKREKAFGDYIVMTQNSNYKWP